MNFSVIELYVSLISLLDRWRDTRKSVDSWPTSGLQLRGSRELALSIRSRSRGILYYSLREFMPDSWTAGASLDLKSFRIQGTVNALSPLPLFDKSLERIFEIFAWSGTWLLSHDQWHCDATLMKDIRDRDENLKNSRLKWNWTLRVILLQAR